MHGYGEYDCMKSNILYIGMFEENLYNGFGILRDMTKDEIYIGYWKKNIKEGIGKSLNKDSFTISRYSKNIEIQQYSEEENLERLFYDNHQHLVKFFNLSYKELKKYCSLTRILNFK